MTTNPLGFAGTTHQTLRTRYGWSKALQLAPDLYPGAGGKRLRATRLERAYAFAGGRGAAPALIVDAVEITPRQAIVTALAISRWKTGRLASLAAWCGAKAAAGDPPTPQAIAALGCRVGICPQMKNDLDELCALLDGSDRCDDLRNHRVTWPWAWAASELSARQFTAWQCRLTQSNEQRAQFRPLAKDLLDVTEHRAVAAINARLDRAVDRLVAATGGDRDAGPLAAICDTLRIAIEPTRAEVLP